MKKITFLFILSFISLSAMTIEDACHQVKEFGNLSAARLLGSSNIPLPAMGINKDLCLKMWNVGRTQSLAKAELTPAEEPKLKKTAEEIALQEKKRQELQEQFEKKQKRKKEFQRQYSAAQKQAENMKFDCTATEELLLEQYNLAQQHLLAIKAQKASEEEEKEKQRLKTQKNDQLYDLQQVESTNRQIIETQYSSNPLIREIYEEMLITLGIFKNAEALYEVISGEKENALKRIAVQYDTFKDYYSELMGHWNFRFFFFQLSRLETAEGDLFHDIKRLALDFCVQNKITMRTAKKGTFYAFFTATSPHPLLKALDDFVMFPLKGLDLSQGCLSPLSVARVISSSSYGLRCNELSPCEKFSEYCEIAQQNALKSDPACVTISHLASKIPFYKILECLHRSDIDRLMDHLEREQKVVYAEALTILTFKNRHTPETERRAQGYFDILKIPTINLWDSCPTPNFIMLLLERLNTSEPLDLQDVVMYGNPTGGAANVWTWYVNTKESFDAKFPEARVRSAFEINQSDFYSFIWNAVIGARFYHGKPIYEGWIEPLKQILDPIHAYFKRVEGVCKNLKLSDEVCAQRYVLDYQEEYDRIFRKA